MAAAGAGSGASQNQDRRPSLVVLYGSQTGCSREVALTIARAVARCRYRTQLVSMEHFHLRRLSEIHRMVAVCSTAGQGQIPDSMRRFWNTLLRRDLPSEFLEHMETTVFGLGDSGYPLFNAAARRLSVRLGQLGARPLLPPGLGDDRHPNGVDGTLIPWLQQLCEILLRRHPQSLATGIPIAPFAEDYLFPVRFQVTPIATEESPEAAESSQEGSRDLLEQSGIDAAPSAEGFRSVAEVLALPASRSGLELYRPYPARVRSNLRMTSADHFQNVRHLVLGVDDAEALSAAHQALPHWQPGDVLVVHPRNPSAAVHSLYERFGLRPDTQLMISVHKTKAVVGTARVGDVEGSDTEEDVPQLILDEDNHADQQQQLREDSLNSGFPQPSTRIPSLITARDLFEVYLGLLGPPSRYFFRILARFALDELERERLAELASPEFHDDFERYCTRELRNFAEVLEDFPSVRLELDLLVDLVPRLQPRQFSLASSRLAHPGEVHLCAAVLERRTPFRRHKVGVCSGWLARLPVGAYVPVWVKPGSLRLPAENSLETPVLCVGPGTGIAPFRAAWQHLQYLQDTAAKAWDSLEGLEGTPLGQGSFNVNSGGCVSSSSHSSSKSGDEESGRGGVYLWCGFRNRAGDFLFGEEMSANAASPHGIIQCLDTTFSRDPPQPPLQSPPGVEAGIAGDPQQSPQRMVGKVYVQHRLLQRARLVWSLLARGGVLLVAGNAGNGMTTAVQDAVVQIAREQGGLGEEQARRLVDRMQKSGIYQVEAW